MQYQPRPGDIGFVMWHDNPISKAIAWFMGSKWSHCFLVAGEMHGQTMLVETSDFEVLCGPLGYYDQRSCSLVIFRAPRPIESAHVAATFKTIRTQYGYAQLLSLGMRRILMRVGKRIKNFFRQGMVCTAVPVAAWSLSSSCPSLTGLDPESLDTQELFDILTSSGWRVIYSKPKGELFT